MHISVATVADAKTEAKTEELREQVEEAYRLAGKTALHWKDLVAALRQVPGIRSDRTAERIVTDLKSHGLISKNLLSQWQKTQ